MLAGRDMDLFLRGYFSLLSLFNYHLSFGLVKDVINVIDVVKINVFGEFSAAMSRMM